MRWAGTPLSVSLFLALAHYTIKQTEFGGRPLCSSPKNEPGVRVATGENTA